MGVFYVKDGLALERTERGIEIRVRGSATFTEDFEVVLTDSEFASVVAHASRRGETGDTYREALDFLEREGE